jgi:hypothetical protein
MKKTDTRYAAGPDELLLNDEPIDNKAAKQQRSGWFVVCKDYERGPFKTREQAELAQVHIEKFNKCCMDHQIEDRTCG